MSLKTLAVGMARLNVRARAVDLLGRQQVAGIPTAISELFKNAHDAYANKVAVDFFRVPRLFLLRDDGVGMSRTDFESRWLTIGTESKVGSASMAPPPRDETQPIRPVMGEKGIGRLAIALIGPQVLIITRAKDAEVDETTLAFINWTVFALPGVDLADIEIPIRTIPGGQLPDRAQVVEMIDAVRKNVEGLKDVDPVDAFRVGAELDQFRFDPASMTLPDEDLDLRRGHGTQFWISPVNEVLAADIDEGRASMSATPLQKVLLGFANTMTPGHELPPIKVSFRDHLGEGLSHERIADDNFFTPEEFDDADHRVSGEFDKRGQFSGSIAVYNGTPVPYAVHWDNKDHADIDCGPFKIDFAYVQGVQKDSRLPRDRWLAIIEKLNRIGGLYIYRNGIRILPYGDSDYDFLGMENRRTRGAGYYFFSYRRIFGVVSITAGDNRKLVEKAGREGFQENKAYRQFKDILENFFVQTAADFFREDGVNAPEYFQEKKRLTAEQALLAKRAKQKRPQLEALQKALDAFFDALAEDRFAIDVTALVDEAAAHFATASERTLTTTGLLGAMRNVRTNVSEIDRSAIVSRPRKLGLTRSLSREWARYEIERANLDIEVFGPAYAQIDELVNKTARRLDLDLDTRRVVADVLEQRGDEERRRFRGLKLDVERNVDTMRERALEITRHSLEAVDSRVRSTLIGFEHLDDVALAESGIALVRARLEEQIKETADAQGEILTRLRDQLKSAATFETLDQEDIEGAIESELEDRRERDLESLQLAQMGMAIGIVHHEFQSVIRVVRQNVRRLKSWADKNQGLNALYEDITKSYSHLDSYLSLFAPLNRRLGREKRQINGQEIDRYLRQLLGDRMERHNVELEATDAFLRATLTDHVATVFPPFVNIVDNSLHWLNSGDQVIRSGQKPRKKVVGLDFDGTSFIISDTGPGILPSDHDAIFESGFSRKPGGTGLGLYITRSLLEQAGYQLTLDAYRTQHGATIRITPPQTALGRTDEDVEA